MKTNFYWPILTVLMVLISCGESAERETENAETVAATEQEPQDPEEARTNWINAWNNRDTQQIQSLAASDAVLVLNGREFPADSISQFYQAAGSAMKDLNMRSLKQGSSDRIAYDTGTYTHSYTNDTTQHQGSYTFIWERGENENEWKVKAMNISDEVNYPEEE